jgi:hypothetical protein
MEVVKEVFEDGAHLTWAGRPANRLDLEDFEINQSLDKSALEGAMMFAKVGRGTLRQTERHYNEGISVRGEHPSGVSLATSKVIASRSTFDLVPGICISRQCPYP